MKRLVTALIMFAVAASFSFADEGEQPEAKEAPVKIVREATLRAGASDFITGKVESVTPAEVLTRPRSKIVITDSSGESKEFIVKALAVIYDSTGQFLTLNDVKPGQEVQINYITKPGRVKEATSVKIVK